MPCSEKAGKNTDHTGMMAIRKISGRVLLIDSKKRETFKKETTILSSRGTDMKVAILAPEFIFHVQTWS
jgi:hypothetical protein